MAPDPIIPTPVVKSTVIEEKTGEAALAQPPPPQVVADDNVRKWLAMMDSIQFVLIVGGICTYLVIHTGPVGTDVLAVLIMVLQAEIAIYMLSRNYYYGGSSGSTAKTASIMEKKG